LVPVRKRLLVDGPDPPESLVAEVPDERPSDEAAGPCNDQEVVGGPEILDALLL
jgi:hypothetical protein